MNSERKARLKKTDIGYGYDSEFPKRLRYLMESENITQDALAENLGLSRQSIAQWKDGKTKPDIYYLDKVADFFKVSTDYLLGRTEDFIGNADVMAVEKRLGLSPISQEVLGLLSQSQIKTSRGESFEYTGGLDVLNLLLESEFLSKLVFEMGRHILQRHTSKYYEEKYGDTIQKPGEEQILTRHLSLKHKLFDDYQEAISKGEFHLFMANQNVLEALRGISEEADKSFNMTDFINNPVGDMTVKRIAAQEEFHKEMIERALKNIDISLLRDLKITEEMQCKIDTKEEHENGEHKKD